MITEAQTLGEVSEEGLLRTIFPFFTLQPGLLVGPGDDAAVLATSGRVVATTDSMVRGRDWLDEWSTAADVGAKLLTQNLADVAAMGGTPTAVLVTLMADPATPAAWARDFARSIGDGAARAGVAVAGGDLSSAPAGVLVVSITALGDLAGRQPVLRNGAEVGDVVAVRGSLGRSAAGLALLQGDGEALGRPTGIQQECLAHHRRPTAPLGAGVQAAAAGATAMIDISDGLLRDADRVARASGVCLALSGPALRPHVEGLTAAVGEETARECVLSGGEEHSLLATFPAGAVPEGWQVLGAVAPGSGVTIDGEPQRPRGWDHFSQEQ